MDAVVLGIPAAHPAVVVEIQPPVGGNAAVLNLKQPGVFLADDVKGHLIHRLDLVASLGLAHIVGQNQTMALGFLIVVARDGHKEVPILISHALVGEGCEIPHLPVQLYPGHIDIASDTHADGSLVRRGRHRAHGHGVAALEQKRDPGFIDFVDGHGGRAEGFSVVFQIVFRVGMELGILDAEHHYLGLRQHVQVFHPVDDCPIHIVAVAQIGEITHARFAMLHQFPIARIPLHPVDHRPGIVVADLGGVQIGIARGKSLGGIAAVGLAHLGDGFKIVVVQYVRGLCRRGHQARGCQCGGTEEQCRKFLYRVFHVNLLTFSR